MMKDKQRNLPHKCMEKYSHGLISLQLSLVVKVVADGTPFNMYSKTWPSILVLAPGLYII